MTYLTTAEEVLRPDAIVDVSDWEPPPIILSKINEDAFGANINSGDFLDIAFYDNSGNFVSIPASPNKQGIFELGPASGEWIEITSAELVIASRYQNSDERNLLGNLKIGGGWQSEKEFIQVKMEMVPNGVQPLGPVAGRLQIFQMHNLALRPIQILLILLNSKLLMLY